MLAVPACSSIVVLSYTSPDRYSLAESYGPDSGFPSLFAARERLYPPTAPVVPVRHGRQINPTGNGSGREQNEKKKDQWLRT